MLALNDPIFVSIERGLPVSLLVQTLAILEEVSLVPYVYHGIQVPPSGLTSNVYAPIAREVEKAKVFFALLPRYNLTLWCRRWNWVQIEASVLRRTPTYIYGINVDSSLPPDSEWRELEDRDGYHVNLLGSAAEFEDSFRVEVGSLRHERES